MHLRLKDEFTHWGMKGRQKRANHGRNTFKGRGPMMGRQHWWPWLTPGEWGPPGNPLDHYSQKRGYHMSGTDPPKDILVYKSSLAGAYVICLTTGFVNFGFKTANEPIFFNTWADGLIPPVLLPHM